MATPWATSDYTYWPTSRVKEVKDADNRITQYTYDALNRPFAVIDPDNRRSETIYDIAGQVVIQKRAVGTALAQDYQTNTFTLNGQLASVKDAKGNLTQYTYDGFDRAKRTTFPSATTPGQVNAADYEELGYDANGNVLTRRTRAGPVVTMTYDTLNRVATKAVPAFGAQASAVTTTYAYDLAGRPTSVSDTLGHALSYTSYDGAGRLETVSATGPQWSGAQAVSYQYDAASNRTRLTWPGGWYASYTYDAMNRMDEVRSSEGNLLLANYDYTPLSRRSLDTLGDGGTVSYGYTLAGDLTSLAQAWSGGGVNFTHTYHPDHRVATSTPSSAAFLWQPLAGGTDAFAAANGLNQYASMTPAGQGARTLTYDSLQNLTSDGVNTFGFDLENRMLSASKAGMSAVYTYDPLGRRVAKSVNGVGTATLFDGDSEIGDIEGGVYVRRYVPGPGIDAPVAIREGAGWVWPRRDRLGSVIARTNAGGLVGSAITYDPYGTSAQASAASGGFLFTGRRYDAETGLYYIRARMYSPALGRFLQTDPVGYADQMNLYAYVGNDPGNATDPSGEFPIALVPAVRAGLTALRITTATSGTKSTMGSAAADYHYAVVGQASCACFAIPFDLTYPPAQSGAGSVDKAGNWTTDGGTRVRDHGRKGSGEAYAAGKGWTGEQIDETANSPGFTEEGGVDKKTGQKTTIKYKDKEWIQQNEDGDVIAMGQRGFGDKPKTNDDPATGTRIRKKDE